MIKIKLNNKEYLYLCQNRCLSDKYKIKSRSKKNENDICILECTEDQVDEIRDKCSERLQIVGFDKNYELTQEGKILEILIDKFFMG